MHGVKMEANGLPVYRRERSSDEEILSGADFLSLLMRSSYYQSYTEPTTHLTSTLPVTTQQPTTPDLRDIQHIRHSRSTPYLPTVPQSPHHQHNNYEYSSDENLQDNGLDNSDESSTLPSATEDDNGVIIAFSVSSSVGRKSNDKTNEQPDSSTFVDKPRTTTTEYSDHNAVASQEQPSILSRASKSEFSVEESEPITTNTDLTPVDYSNANSFPANVRPLSRKPDASSFNSDIRPLHETVVFHDNEEPSRARSVSYSAVIQSIAHNGNHRDAWNDENDQVHDRRERHYDGENPPPMNDFSRDQQKPRTNSTKMYPAEAETNHFYVTTNPENEQSIEKTWEAPRVYVPEIPSVPPSKPSITTERNWEESEKSYTAQQEQNLPTVYGKPEENYEVDEAVSVNSNGRVHGVQPSQPENTPKPESRVTHPPKKPDDNQKVGYVVEGRNYRKYRVEERTSDGFIVGEYGVVSHDDGSLRGVRYTADGTINPRLIYDALMKFLSL